MARDYFDESKPKKKKKSSSSSTGSSGKSQSSSSGKSSKGVMTGSSYSSRSYSSPSSSLKKQTYTPAKSYSSTSRSSSSAMQRENERGARRTANTNVEKQQSYTPTRTNTVHGRNDRDITRYRNTSSESSNNRSMTMQERMNQKTYGTTHPNEAQKQPNRILTSQERRNQKSYGTTSYERLEQDRIRRDEESKERRANSQKNNGLAAHMQKQKDPLGINKNSSIENRYNKNNPKTAAAEKEKRIKKRQDLLDAQAQKSGILTDSLKEKQAKTKQNLQKTGLGRFIGNAQDRWGENAKSYLQNSAVALADVGDIMNTGKTHKGGRLSQDMEGLLPNREEQRRKYQNSYKEYLRYRDETERRKQSLTGKAKGLEKHAYSAEESGQGMLTDWIVGQAFGGRWEIPLALRTYGQSRGKLEAEGATAMEDRLNAAKDAFVEVMTEKMGGFMGAAKFAPGKKFLKPFSEKVEGRILGKLGSGTARDVASGALRWGRNILEEAAEEWAGNPAQNLGENIIFRNRQQAEREAENRASYDAMAKDIQSYLSQNPGEVERYISEVNSEENRQELIDHFKEGGMSDAQATSLADKSIEFMVAAAEQDTERMNELVESLGDDLVGDARKKVWDWSEQLESLASTALLMGVTGSYGAISTTAQGMAIKNAPNGTEQMKKALQKIIDFDGENSTKSQALLDRMNNGYEPTATQAFDIMQDERRVMAEAIERQAAANNIKSKAMQREDLRIPPAVENEDGSYNIVGDETAKKYEEKYVDTMDYVESINEPKYEGKLDEGDAEIAATAVASYEAGTLTPAEISTLTLENPEARDIFQTMTGVALNEYNVYDRKGNIKTAESNVNMQQKLLAKAAQNYVESARAEQEAWNDSARGEMSEQIANSFSPGGNIAVHDALDAVDPRDRSAFMLTGRVAQDVYKYAWRTEDSWNEVKRKYGSIYSSVKMDSLKGVYEAAKQDKADAETPYLNAQVIAGEAMGKIERGEVKGDVRGKFVNQTPFNALDGTGRNLKDSERIVLEELSRGFNTNTFMVDAQDENLEHMDANEKLAYANAKVNLSTGTVFISNAADVGKAVHEFTHIGAKLAASQYLEMSNYILDAAEKHNPEKTQDLYDKYKALYSGKGLSEKELEEEIVSDLVADFINDPVFIRSLEQGDPTIMRRVLNVIEDILRALRNILATGHIKDPAIQDSFLNEIGAWDEARKLWLNMYAEAQRNSAALGIANWQDAVNERHNIAESSQTLSYENARKLYENADFANDSSLYDYDFLVQMPDMKVVQALDLSDIKLEGSKIDRAKIKDKGIENAKAVGKESGDIAAVTNRYTGRELRISRGAIGHSLNGAAVRRYTNGRLNAKAGELVQNAIPINALINNSNNQKIESTYLMAAYATGSDGREFVALITVEQEKDSVSDIELHDLVHAISGRTKKSNRIGTKPQGIIPFAVANYKIADFLADVNETYKSALSQNVLDFFNEQRPPAGEYTGKVKFSLNEPVERVRDLVAVHNLTEDKLRGDFRLGGFPMPSIAVTNQNHENFGNISLLFGSDTIDPKKNRANKVYSADAWTPTVPMTDYEADSKVASNAMRTINELVDGAPVTSGLSADLHADNIAQVLTNERGIDGFISRIIDRPYMKYAYLKSQGQEVDVPYKDATLQGHGRNVWEKIDKAIPEITRSEAYNMDYDEAMKYEPVIRDIVREDFLENLPEEAKQKPRYTNIYKEQFAWGKVTNYLSDLVKYRESNGFPQVVDEKAFNDLLDESIDKIALREWAADLFDGIVKDSGVRNQADTFTASGNRRSFKATHYPATLDGILKAMKEQGEKNVSYHTSTKTLRADTAKTFKSLDEIRKNKGKLQNLTEEEQEAIYKEIDDKFYEIINRIGENTPKDYDIYAADNIADIMAECAQLGYTKPEQIVDKYKEYSWNATEQDAKDILQLFNAIENMPVNMFEAKPRRAVGFDEVKAAIVPEGTSQDILDGLEAEGIPVTTYNKDVEGDRSAKLNEVAETQDLKFSLPSTSDIMNKLEETFNEYKEDETNLRIATEAIRDLQRVRYAISESSDRNVSGRWDGGVQVRTIAKGISSELVTEGYVEFRGQKVESPEDLAKLCQVLRDPRFETFRLILTKNNKIVSFQSISARMPGVSPIHNMETDEDYDKYVLDLAARTKADGFYLLHNHPSGFVSASKPDLVVTARMINLLGHDMFKGHVILDHDKFGLIEDIPQKVAEGWTLPSAREVEITGQQTLDLIHEPEVDHPLLGEKISDSESLATIGSSVNATDGYSVIVYTDSRLQVRGIQEISSKTLAKDKGVKGFIRNQATEFGATSSFIYTNNADSDVTKAAHDLYTSGIVKDVAFSDSLPSFLERGMNQRGDAFQQGYTDKELKKRSVVFDTASGAEDYSGLKYSITPKMDADYIAAIRGGNMEEAQRLVEEAAKNAGYMELVYHGTGSYFSVFDADKTGRNHNGYSKYGKGFYFSSSEDTANYWGQNRRLIKAYIKLENPFDASGFLSEGPLFEEWKKLRKKVFPDSPVSEKRPASDVIETLNEYKGRDFTTNFLKNLGYDGVIVHHGESASNYTSAPWEGTTEYIVFEAEQIKSADTITYTDNETPIMLSERFNPENKDIRYSLPTQDADGKVLSDGQMEYFKNSQARDEMGRLVRVFHTTNKGGFTVFDPSFSDDHRSLFFAESRDISLTYGGWEADRPIDLESGENQSGYYECYLNLENPLIIDADGSEWDDIILGGSKIDRDASVMARTGAHYRRIAEGIKDADIVQERLKKAEELEKDDFVEFHMINGGDSEIVSFIIPRNADMAAEKINEYFGLDADNDFGYDVASELLDELESSSYTQYSGLDMRALLDEFSYTTREIAEMAENEGYDGVIIRNLKDIGSHASDFRGLKNEETDIYIAFSSNQVKDVNNLNPTENPDIRFSITPEDDALSRIAYAHAMDNSNEALEYYEQLIDRVDPETYNMRPFNEEKVAAFYAALNADEAVVSTDPVEEESRIRMARSKADFYNNLNTKWNDRWHTEGEVLDVKSVKKDIRELVMGVMSNSDTDRKYKTELVNKMLMDVRTAFQLMKQDRQEVAASLLYHSALRMIEGAEFYIDDTYDQYRELKDFFRTSKISLGEEYWSDVDFGSFRKNNFGRMKLVKGSTNVDQVYMELADIFPEWFNVDETLSVPDMLEQIAHVLDAVQPYKEAYSSEAAADLAFDIADELYDIMVGGKEIKSLADQYKERYDAKTKAMKQRHAEAMLRMRRQRDLGVQAERAKWRAREEARKEKTQHNKYFDRISKNYNKLVKRLFDNTKDSHIPEQYKKELAKLLSVFDLQTVGSKKVQERRGVWGKNTIKMAATKAALNNISARAQAFKVNDAITDLMDELLAAGIDNKTIDELSVSELQKIDDIMKALVYAFNNYEKVLKDNKKQSTANFGNAQVDDCLKHAEVFGPGKDYHGLFGALDKIINLDEQTAAYLFRRIDPNYTGIGAMWKEVRKSFDKYVRNTAQLKEWMEEITGEYHNKGRFNKYGSDIIDQWRSINYTQTFNLTNGTVMLTPAQMMSIYCLAKRPQAYGHMVRAGIVVKPVSFNAKMMTDLKKKADRSLPIVLTDADIQTIRKALTPDQVNVAKKLQELMATKMAAWGNEASMDVIGIELFHDENYFPIKSDKAALESDLSADQFVDSVRNFGFAKAVAPGARNAIMVDDIFDVVAEHCNNMNLYNSYSRSMDDFMKVLNYRQFREDGREYTVKQAIGHAYSQKAVTFILQLMRDLNGNVSGGDSGISSMYNRLLGNAKAASVMGNGRVLLQQPTAITRAFAVINPKYIKGIRIDRGVMDEMWEHCPIALWKSWGYYDINMGRPIEDVIMNEGSIADDLLAGSYGVADNITWAAIWQMVKAEMKDTHPDVEIGSEEYWTLANERMSEVVDFTQVVDSPIHRSHGMRSKNYLERTATAFMAEPTLTFNMIKDGLIRAFEAYKLGDKKVAAKALAVTASVFATQAITVSLAQALWDTLRGKGTDDDDEEEKSRLLMIWTNFLENLGDEVKIWNKIYFVKDIDSLMRGYGFSNMALQGFKMMIDGWNQLTGSHKVYSSKTWYENFFGGYGYITGQPIQTLIRDGKAIYNLFGLDWDVANAVGDYLDSLPDVFQSGKEEVDSSTFLGKLINITSSEEESGKKSSSKKKKKGSKSKDKEESKAQSHEEERDTLRKLDAKAKEKVEGLSGGELDEVLWDTLSDGYTKKLEAGDYDYIEQLRNIYRNNGGDVSVFDAKVKEKAKSAYKKMLKDDMTQEDIDKQFRMQLYMEDQLGMSEAEISEIVYKSDAAKDLKVAFRINDEKAIQETGEQLVRAGLTEADWEKLYKNRNRMKLDSYTGKYKDRLKSTGNFIWPTEGTITSKFGHRDSPGGIGSTNHPAIDIGAPMGAPVSAADGGTVIYVGYNGGYGNSVGIKHDNGMVTYYNHLSGWNVNEGDTVSQGQEVGQVGSTGNSTGPHLDFKVLDADGNPVDPEQYLDVSNAVYDLSA